ncbi:hypothetical protein STANM309S_02567 [Streptomyces tanashiensis]
MAGRPMQIGEVAARTELSLRTIRQYEDSGLVVPSAASPGGFPLYTDADVSRLMVVRRMKPLGFTLDETRELLTAVDRLAADRPGTDTGPNRASGPRWWPASAATRPRRRSGSPNCGPSSPARRNSPTPSATG